MKNMHNKIHIQKHKTAIKTLDRKKRSPRECQIKQGGKLQLLAEDANSRGQGSPRGESSRMLVLYVLQVATQLISEGGNT